MDFEDIALDPMAKFATLYVTIDSSISKSTEAWKLIDFLAAADMNEKAREIAGQSLARAVLEPTKKGGSRLQEREYLTQFYGGFVDHLGSSQGSFWDVYGSPTVFDMSEDRTFKTRAVKRRWTYHGHAADEDLSTYAKIAFPLSATGS